MYETDEWLGEAPGVSDQGEDPDSGQVVETSMGAQGEGTPRRRPRRSQPVTRRQAEAVLGRLDALSGASQQERDGLAVVLGAKQTDPRSLTVSLVCGAEPRNARALGDLLEVAEADPGDREMVALTLGVGASGMKRLRAAWGLAVSLGLAQGAMSSNPVQVGRDLAAAAGSASGTLAAIRDLLG